MERGATARACAAGALLTVWAASPGQARAQSRTVPLGGRTATMGMAATAAGRDSAMPYVNPAGLGQLSTDVLALSASVYAVQSWRVDGLLGPSGLSPAYGPTERTSSERNNRSVYQLPSSVMYVKHIGSPADPVHHVLGVALVIPQVTRDRFSASDNSRVPQVQGTLSRSADVSTDDTSYYLGPTYGLALGPLRLGASGFLLYRSYSSSFSAASTLTQRGGTVTDTVSYRLREESESLALAPIVGAQLDVTDRWRLGAALAVPPVALGGSSTSPYSYDYVSNVAQTAILYDRSGKYRDLPPLRVNAGVAYEVPGSFSLALDVVLHGGRRGAYRTVYNSHATERSAGDVTRVYDRRERYEYDRSAVVDVSIGAEVFVVDWLSVRAGWFTDRASKSEVDTQLTRADPTSAPWEQRVNAWGATLGLGLQVGPVDTTVGAIYRRSTGEIVVYENFSQRAFEQQVSSLLPSTSISSHTLLFVLSGAVSTSEARKTIEDSLPTTRTLPSPKGMLP